MRTQLVALLAFISLLSLLTTAAMPGAFAASPKAQDAHNYLVRYKSTGEHRDLRAAAKLIAEAIGPAQSAQDSAVLSELPVIANHLGRCKTAKTPYDLEIAIALSDRASRSEPTNPEVFQYDRCIMNIQDSGEWRSFSIEDSIVDCAKTFAPRLTPEECLLARPALTFDIDQLNVLCNSLR